MRVTLVNNDAKEQWELELGKYCLGIQCECERCTKENRCKELTKKMRGY